MSSSSAQPAEVEIPSLAAAVPRLAANVSSLMKLCKSDTAPCRRVRPKFSASVLNGFGDASGTAFGDASQFQNSSDIHFQFGQWMSSVTQEESSNWQEFTSLVEHLEERNSDGQPCDAEAFMFTDNSAAEAAFWKGTSKSRKLLHLVLRLRQLEMTTGMILHSIHVSGKRMIAQGTDGLSRGDHLTGALAGQSLTAFMLLQLGVFERSPTLKEWAVQTLGGCDPFFFNRKIGLMNQLDKRPVCGVQHQQQPMLLSKGLAALGTNDPTCHMCCSCQD